MTRLLPILTALLPLLQLSMSSAIPHDDDDAALEAAPAPAIAERKSLQQVLDTWPKNPASKYPSDFTRDIFPKPIHSHNDYWRTTPLYTALSYGAISIEADVWLVNNTLLVGHDTASLTPNRTLASLYIDPLLEILSRQTPGGVFDVQPFQTLYLWIDIKTTGATTWAAVIKALQPLRDRNLLSNTGDDGLVSRQITIIGTGNAPYDDIASRRKRDYFVDANLQDLDNPPAAVHISPFASTSLRDAVGDIGPAGLTKDQLEVVKGQVSVAQWKGVKARYWDTPQWPKRLRTKVMRQLVEAGVGLLSVDDLREAAEEDW